MKQEYVIQAVKTMGLDPQVIKSIQMDTEEVVVEYFVTDSYGNRVDDPVEQETVTTFVTYPIMK